MGDDQMSLPQTVALVSYKAGVGKSTSAVFLSFAFHHEGRRVLLVDADPGRSILRWADVAAKFHEPFPFEYTALSAGELDRKLYARSMGGTWDWIIVDCPQLEDHPAIGAAAMRHADHWVMPMAPVGIEFDRAMKARKLFDQVQDELDGKGLDAERVRWALLNRTNRRSPSKSGPDTQYRQHLSDVGFRVFDGQIENADDRYRQVFGVAPINAAATPYLGIAQQLEKCR